MLLNIVPIVRHNWLNKFLQLCTNIAGQRCFNNKKQLISNIDGQYCVNYIKILFTNIAGKRCLNKQKKCYNLSPTIIQVGYGSPTMP